MLLEVEEADRSRAPLREVSKANRNSPSTQIEGRSGHLRAPVSFWEGGVKGKVGLSAFLGKGRGRQAQFDLGWSLLMSEG